jgi:hypothetical protein
MMPREPYLNARQAARFVGFEPGDRSARSDKEMRRFYAWVRRARVPTHRRAERCLLFRVSELEGAIAAATSDAPETNAALTQMEALAREHVLGIGGRR